jgi:NAD(P)H-dependent flavin oxidoreductase YrpB (nitropropane dioxygenase family)
VIDWGVDAVLVQGGEGGGHTGSVPTTLLLPQVVDTVAGRIPVIAAGGFFDGRGLVAALAYGASGVAMGTRFLLTSDSSVPDAVKQYYLSKTVNDTIVSKKVDGVPHRVLRSELVEKLESGTQFTAWPRAIKNALEFKKLSGMKVKDLMKEGLAMKKSSDLTYRQVLMAANTPMLLKVGIVDGNVAAGVFASGQAVGVIDDLPTVAELIARIIAEAEATLKDLGASP